MSGGTVDEATFLAGFCNALGGCCIEAGLGASAAKCQVLFAAANEGQKFDPVAGKVCLDWLDRASQGGKACPDDDNAPAECAVALVSTGTKAPGEACISTNDCAPSTEGSVDCASAYVSSMTIQKCQVQPFGVLGSAPCAGTKDGNVIVFEGNGEDVPPKAYLCDKADGLRCDGTACVAVSAVGGSCLSSYDCTDGNYCDYVTETCTPHKTAGAVCATFYDECGPETYCDQTTTVCTAGLGDGATCTESQQCKSMSCINGACNGDKPVDLGLTLICGE